MAMHPVPAIQDIETSQQSNARMQWFREARFGMFIHWGLYSIPRGRWDGNEVPGIGEWIMNRASIPVAQYQALAARFNPTQFSAAEIVGLAESAAVGLAKSAGMRYIVITSKHHDGFATFNSKANPFN
jgi:alpha-L-fucosidase